MNRLFVLSYSASVGSAVWVYTWPYGASNTCKCVEQSIGSILTFATADDCLRSFASEDDEYCTYETEGLSQHKCASAVSIKQGFFNTDCQTMCNEMITGFISEEEFTESCKLELIANIGTAVAPASGSESCFASTVYGWGDFDPHNNVQGAPVAVHQDVDTPSGCQELCQMTKTCVYFSWRATCDNDPSAAESYQSAVNTCLLYDKDYMTGVLSVDTSNTDSLILGGNSKYCNAESLGNQCSLSVINNSTFFFPYGANHNCLRCGCLQKCAWNSNSHITGPKFCGDVTQDACNFPLSEVTTTTTPANCPTETCAEGGTATTTAGPGRRTTTTARAGPTTTGVELDTTTHGSTTGIELDSTTATPARTTTTAKTPTTTAGHKTTTTRMGQTTTLKRPEAPTCAECKADCDDEFEDCDCDDYC